MRLNEWEFCHQFQWGQHFTVHNMARYDIDQFFNFVGESLHLNLTNF